MRTIIVYYSQGGNTRAVARLLSGMLKADLYEIRTRTPYPDDYDLLLGLGKKEVESGYMPPVEQDCPDLDAYDAIVFGTPVWWGTFAPAVRTFLSEHGWKGRHIYPFATNGGSIGRTTTQLKRAMRGAVIAPTLNLRFEDRTLVSPAGNIRAWAERVR